MGHLYHGYVKLPEGNILFVDITLSGMVFGSGVRVRSAGPDELLVLEEQTDRTCRDPYLRVGLNNKHISPVFFLGQILHS
jgi:hypothetical protein